jgi:hypothetical protein
MSVQAHAQYVFACLSRRHFLQAAGLAGAGLAFGSEAAAEPATRAVLSGAAQASDFAVSFEQGAIRSLKYTADTIDTEYVEPGARLGDVILRFRNGSEEWRSLETWEVSERRRTRTSPDGLLHETTITAGADGPEVEVGFAVEGAAVRWTITVRNPSGRPLEIGDLAVPLPINRNRRRGAASQGQAPSSPPVLKHSLVSGDGSFFFWMRSNSVGPYLVLTVDEGTKLEYWEAHEAYRVFVHSAASGAVAAERGCNWRQPNTSLKLPPGEEQTYGFTLRWAHDYDHVRQILVEQGLIDVQVVPGMTVPADLFARFALRSNEPIHAVEGEFPDETEIRSLGRKNNAHLFEVRFSRLGENRLTVHFGAGRQMYLEFFSAEPLETLIKKRGAFLAAHQWRDPTLWYDGLIAEWAMDTQVMLGPDNYDRIEGWRRFVVTANDAGMGKTAFLAAKNAEFPVQGEVEALDYYTENFVWGGLQKTTEETFSYGIYHTPDWKQNRESHDPGRGGQQHVWRIYDYPHIVLMYLGLYRVAKHHPHIRTSMEAKDYLRRAYGTALAMFTIPWEIERWSAYETGLMNGLVVEDVIDALYVEEMRHEAERLRPHWERKVRTFVNDQPDLVRSEYAFDTTGFEETHALAKYALRVAEPGPVPDREVRPGWVDYPPSNKIPLESAQEFMETQMAANVFCRGWVETAYWILGSDIRSDDGNTHTLSYMSQMGGWSVLDYALHFAEDPVPYLRLGYASYLSAWALMNTGTPESDYGFWYSGSENDGGAGHNFQPAPFADTWAGPPMLCRGSWFYSGEIDLGFCGALRCARTVLADDPLFGRFCFGGDWREAGGALEVIPKDGVRRRFHAILGTGRLHLETEADRLAPDRPIVLREDLSQIQFQLESDNPETHTTRMQLEGLEAGTYELRQDRGPARHFTLTDGRPAILEVLVAGRRGSGTVTITRVGG